MKQKLALSCALIHRPELLLLDEPTTGVDAVSRSEFWDMLAGLRQKGITILVSTSYMDEATRCGRMAMIDKGKILTSGTPSELVKSIGENLYNAVATDMFGLLSALREMPAVTDCYTFGAPRCDDRQFQSCRGSLPTEGGRNYRREDFPRHGRHRGPIHQTHEQ